jgi:hypothetical protein
VSEQERRCIRRVVEIDAALYDAWMEACPGGSLDKLIEDGLAIETALALPPLEPLPVTARERSARRMAEAFARHADELKR